MDSIDLISFLCNFYGIVNENLKINKLTHTDIKILFPQIKRISIERLNNNLALVYNGDIILVYDCFGKILPYVNPHLQINVCPINENSYAERERINLNSLELDELSKEELLNIRRQLKRNHKYLEEKDVVKVIRKKKDYQVTDYKRRKNMLKMEEIYD